MKLMSVETSGDLRACFELMRELRPHLKTFEEFVERWSRQRVSGYRLTVLMDGDCPVALAGFRIQENLVHGRHLYVDDLVTLGSTRGNGYGKVIMDELKAEARRLNCSKLALDTPVTNFRGHRFYYREGLAATAFRFTMDIG